MPKIPIWADFLLSRQCPWADSSVGVVNKFLEAGSDEPERSKKAVPGSTAFAHFRVEARSLAGNRFRVRPRVAVLACGGIENARLLLLSAGVAPRGIGNAHDWVGRCFMDHPGAQPLGTFQILRGDAGHLAEQPRPAGGLKEVMVGLGLDAETRRAYGLLNSVLWVGRAQPVAAGGSPAATTRGRSISSSAPGSRSRCRSS